MTKILWNALKNSPGVVSAAALLMASPALANSDQPTTNTSGEGLILAQAISSPPQPLPDPSLGVIGVSELQQANPMGQVTSVSQLSDVDPTDWAFQALQSLVERYGCIAGYPDGTYRGNRAMTRYEFAAGLNACLDRITELIAASTADLVTRDDLAILQRLQEEFAAELAVLTGRVDTLEARTAELEANQFSTTTKLKGEALFILGDTFGDQVNGHDADVNTFLGYRARLVFDTSFTGKDRLRTRLSASALPNLAANTDTLMSRISTDGFSDGFELDDLTYRFPLGNRTLVYFGANSLDLDDIGTPLTPFNSSGGASISRFGQRNPVIYRGPEGAGGGIQIGFTDSVALHLGYLAADAADPGEGGGLFNGPYTAMAQLLVQPTSTFGFSFQYAYKYWGKGQANITGSTGSEAARQPFGDAPTTADNAAFEFNWAVSDGFQLGAWVGATFARTTEEDSGDATILNGAVTLAFPDLFKEGSLGGIIVGVPPKLTDIDGGDEDEDTSLHIEAFYRLQLNDNISITPGLLVVTNPDHDSNNDTVWVTVLRTQFRF
ncbi:MAG: iron uptake porin [Cyanobacteriota bacterium]|nr:iron uptake porin [Cyanobacteriota bacterium]